jgi:ATP-dependent Clp protease adaptor protein ClpS
MEFVIETLVTIFNHSPESAEAVTKKIHEEGSGIAAILPYEMAEQKGVEVTQLARNNGFPLNIKLEPAE